MVGGSGISIWLIEEERLLSIFIVWGRDVFEAPIQTRQRPMLAKPPTVAMRIMADDETLILPSKLPRPLPGLFPGLPL
jgi:hypothetical protein